MKKSKENKTAEQLKRKSVREDKRWKHFEKITKAKKNINWQKAKGKKCNYWMTTKLASANNIIKRYVSEPNIQLNEAHNQKPCI